MKINKLNIRKGFVALALTSTLVLTGCNKQVLDFNKAFNVALEPNDENISVVGIVNYADYEGSQVQFETADGLRILSSTHKLQLINVKDRESLDNYTNSLSNDNLSVIYYDDNFKFGKAFNKKVLEFDYLFNKAIILNGDNALIIKIDTWKDYEDDKIQIKLPDGTCILTEIDNVKIINDEKAEEGAIERYAISLVGSEEKVNYYDAKPKLKTK